VAQHISRKELKQDQIRETLVHGAEAVVSHQKPLWIGVAVVAFVLVAVFGWRFYSERQTGKAAAALETALEAFHARIRTPSEPAAPGESTYFDEKNKFEDAAKKLTEVADNYSRTRPGRTARYYAGLSYVQLGKSDEAEKAFRAAESGSDAELSALARFQLAQLYTRAGKSEQAVQLYQQLLDKPATMVPKPVVMLALADHYRATKPAEAIKLLNQLKAEFPESALVEEADKRLEGFAPKT
jgi:tetratricopeptide (TPR) repeat protein